MKLTTEQQRELRERHGICADEACDSCRKVLGEVRFTRIGEPGEWCSRQCRDGLAAAQQYAATRKTGRPRKYETDADRQRAYRTRQAA
jgi:hypothetical protein